MRRLFEWPIQERFTGAADRKSRAITRTRHTVPVLDDGPKAMSQQMSRDGKFGTLSNDVRGVLSDTFH